MPVEVVWDNEAHTILRQIYRGYTTLDDYLVATDEVLRLAKTVPHTVHSIMDRTHILSTPGSLIPALRYANANVPPNLGARVVVKPTMFTRILVDIGRRIAPRLTDKVHFTNSLEEAHTLINRQYLSDPEIMV